MAKAQGLPADFVALLAAQDKRKGFPAGTMQSVVKQEVGSRAGEFLQNPSLYHYGLNAEGKRIAGHTGKVSTAFGPFAILESTGADPGYRVTPLKDKSLGEQVRFAADYLAARSKSGGGLLQGLAGYGEGAKYAEQVMAKIGGIGPPSRKTIAAGNASARTAGVAAAYMPAAEVAAQALPEQEVAQAPPQQMNFEGAIQKYPEAVAAQAEANPMSAFGQAMPMDYMAQLRAYGDLVNSTAPVQQITNTGGGQGNGLAQAIKSGRIASFMPSYMPDRA